MTRYLQIVVVVLCLSVVDVATPFGQATTTPSPATVVVGRVTDDIGGAIPGAAVVLENPPATIAKTVTNAIGEFQFHNVAQGAYTVRVSLSGFRPSVTRVTIPPDQPRVDVGVIRLSVGALTEAVTVTSGRFDGLRALVGGRQPGSGTSQNLSVESYAPIVSNAFRLTDDTPLSTFAADVDTASYSNIRRFLRHGERPPIDAVRVEEIINYFRFSYPEPLGRDPVSLTAEVGECPWAPEHRLALIGVRARSIRDVAEKPRNIVLLIDVSGSMMSPDKLPLLQTAFRRFADTLRPTDRLAIVVYAGQSGLVLPSTPGRERSTIHAALANLEAGGSTNGAAGIQQAYRVAREHFAPGGINRVILATDGDFNVGVTSQGDLVRLIERERESGVFLTVLGVGTGNLKDSTMEMLADKGNGTYAYLDSVLEAERVLIKEGGSTLETVAKDVKFQVEFNPAQVAAWKLIGYENRLLADADFNDDAKDAGDLGAGHTVTVLYEIVPAGTALPKSLVNANGKAVDPLRYQSNRRATRAAGTAELMTVKLRFKEPDGSRSRLMAMPVAATGEAPHLPFAAAVAEFGLMLRESDVADRRWRALVARLESLTDGAGVVKSYEDIVSMARAAAKVR